MPRVWAEKTGSLVSFAEHDKGACCEVFPFGKHETDLG